MNSNIPKIIHYCWFGESKLPKSAEYCINSWKKYLPDYKIIQWNEKNFDIKSNTYCYEAYRAKKYAFVSDYARFKILYELGGIYFDTDVEVLRSLNPIIDTGAFMGCETINEKDNFISVAPGLGFGVPPKNDIINEIIDGYDKSSFLFEDGSYDLTTIVEKTSNIFIKHGLKPINEIQEIKGFKIYPPEFFCPKNKDTFKLSITENTYSIHHYDATWYSNQMRLIKWIKINFGLDFLKTLVKVKRVVKKYGKKID